MRDRLERASLAALLLSALYFAPRIVGALTSLATAGALVMAWSRRA